VIDYAIPSKLSDFIKLELIKNYTEVMKMEESKPIYLSKTVIASVIVIVATVLGPFGIDIDAGTQTQLVDFLLAITTAVAGIVAIYSRVKATKVIRSAKGE